MKRRQVIRTVGPLLAMGAVAGCSDAASSIGGGLSVANINARSTDFGNVELRVIVENSSSDQKRGLLVGTVDVHGGDSYTESRRIVVGSKSSRSFELKFDIAFSESMSGFRYSYDAWVE